MKTISILIPCYNEQENVREIAAAVIDIMEQRLTAYNYELIFIDNCSTDMTRVYLRELCGANNRIKAIFNVRNFGQFSSPYYGILQTSGDCTISMSCDFQDPVELIPVLVKKWEEGYKIVSAIKTSSKENAFIFWCRSCYYKTMKKFADVEMIEQFTGFGLYDRSFINILRDLHDPIPFLRGIVAEFGFKRVEIPFEQPNRRAGKTHNNFYTLYDAAMLSITSYTQFGLRLATLIGAICGIISILLAVFFIIWKCLHWYTFAAGIAPIIILILVIGSVQLFFLGLLGEYVLNMNKRIMNRPLVIEEERINF